jgi:hypothetical protein
MTHEGMWRIYSNPDPHGVAGSGEKESKILFVYFYSFAIISPWRRAPPFI